MDEKTMIRDIDILRMSIEQLRGLRIPAGDAETIRTVWDLLQNLGSLVDAMAERDRRAQEAGGETDVPD